MKRYNFPSRHMLVSLLFLVSIGVTVSCGGTKQALVLGNGAYAVAPLANPANDARDMAAALTRFGFDVTLHVNVGQRDMENAIRQFAKKLNTASVGLFYYAGHGVQMDGHNYLVPVDAKIEGEVDVKYVSVNVGRVLDSMAYGDCDLNIVVLDACRDNPYSGSFRSITRGLARVDAAKGSFVAYSTAPGQVALDGAGRNSPYTAALLHYTRQPGLTLEQVFKHVRRQLDRDTGGKQIPWESTSLTGDFCFVPGTTPVASLPLVKPTPSVSGPTEKLAPLPVVRADPIVGVWKWFNGTVTINADGTVRHGGLLMGLLKNRGTWECIDSVQRKYSVRWNVGKWVDTLVLSPDGNKLQGVNSNGKVVSAKRRL